ncbi:MAG: tetratricopeptide repeat protein [Planctomycetota bacterium]
MNLIQRLKIWKELRRLEQRAQEVPSPSTFIDLGQVYINLDMHERALSLAEDGLALFPQSQELRKLRRFAKKNQVASAIDTARAEVGRTPSPEAYHKLASLHLELGDFEAVQGVCEECIRRFPNDPSVRLLLGRAWLTNFYRDLRAREGAAAVEHLERSLETENPPVDAHRLLAELFWRLGADTRSKAHLKALENQGPLDAELTALKAQLQKRPSGGEADLEQLLHRAETQGRLPRSAVQVPAAGVTPQGAIQGGSGGGLRDALANLAGRDGVRKATYIRGSKALVKGDIKGGRDSFLRATRVIARSSQRAARRMDIGNFNKGVVRGDFGQICLCSFGEALAAVECDDRIDSTEILSELQELVAGSLVQNRFEEETA